MRTAIDSNAISAIWSAEPIATDIKAALRQSSRLGGLVVCPIVFAELHAHPRATPRFVKAFLEEAHITVDWAIKAEVWEFAAEKFAAYSVRRRKQHGAPKRMIADMLIGAHAYFEADRLITLDQSRFKADFPKLRLLP